MLSFFLAAILLASSAEAPSPVTIDSCLVRTDLQYVEVTFEPSENTTAPKGSSTVDIPSLIPHRVQFDIRYFGEAGWATTTGRYDSFSAPYDEVLILHGTKRIHPFHRANVSCRVARVYLEDGSEWVGPGPWSPGDLDRP